MGQFSTFALAAWKYATFFICFCFTKFCVIKFFLLSLSLLFPARSCCCCYVCGPAFIPLCVCVSVLEWVCLCPCVLAFYDPIWPPSAAYVFSLASSVSLSRSVSGSAVLCWVYELYRFLCGRILFLFAIPLCIFFCFCSSAFFLPFLDFCCLLCRLAFFGCHKNVFLYVRRRYLAGRSSRHNVAPARLGLFSPAAAPYEYFCLACHWLLCSARLAFIILVYYIHIYIYSYIYICMCHVCVLHAHSFAVATHFELAAFVIFALISYFVCFLLPMPLPLLFIPHK